MNRIQIMIILQKRQSLSFGNVVIENIERADFRKSTFHFRSKALDELVQLFMLLDLLSTPDRNPNPKGNRYYAHYDEDN